MPAGGGLVAALGLAAIASSATMYSEATLFPGLNAALPVLGAATVLANGLRGRHLTERWFLGVAPMQLLGRLLYGWYLWHWLPLVLCTSLLQRPPTASEELILAGLTLLLPLLTYLAVETPFRTGVTFAWSPRNGMPVGSLFMVIGLVANVSVLRPATTVTGDPGTRAAQIEIFDAAVDVSTFGATGPVPGNRGPPGGPGVAVGLGISPADPPTRPWFLQLNEPSSIQHRE